MRCAELQQEDERCQTIPATIVASRLRCLILKTTHRTSRLQSFGTIAASPRLYEPALARGAEDIREAHKVQTLPIVAANNVKLK